jgi:hypothetical protein
MQKNVKRELDARRRRGRRGEVRCAHNLIIVIKVNSVTALRSRHEDPKLVFSDATTPGKVLV